jgi:hypothetical protein
MGVLVYDTPLTIDQVLTRLTEQPKAIATLTAGLPRARLHTAPSRGECPSTKSTNYPELEFAPSFRAYSKQRAELLALLRPLPKAAWSRSATVTGAGRPRDRTVLEYAQWLATHERSHVKQIARSVDGSIRRTA